MADTSRKPPKQYAPVKFGEPFNPNSVEGHHWKQRQAAAIRARKEREAQDAELDAIAADEHARLSSRSWLARAWDRWSGRF